MIKDYAFVSPSLEGVLSHEILSYEGIRRPVEVLRALDGPSADKSAPKSSSDQDILERYFYDLYGVFMKKLSAFVLDTATTESDSVKLQAMLQEMIKIKKLIVR